MRLRVVLGLSLLTLTGLILAAPARQEEGPKTVEREMVGIGRRLVAELQRRGYTNVGVLKFLVSNDGKQLSDGVGTLNMRLAKQLELALIVRNDPRNPVGVIKNASAVAQITKGADHTGKSGKGGIARLFGAKYKLHWGNNQVTADAFITGVAFIKKDLTGMFVQLQVVDGKDNRLSRLEGFAFTARMDPSKLAEAGESFVLRGIGDDGETEVVAVKKAEKAAVKAAVKAREEKKENPYFAPASEQPVRLEVLYNGEPVQIVFKDGRAHIPTPTTKTKVQFRLIRDGSPVKYAVVLKVNGENTVGMQKLPDLECRKWVLVKGRGPLLISGYQKDDKTRLPFTVVPRSEASRLAMHYGDDAGTISITVFRERTGEEPTEDPLDRDGSKETIVKKGKLPEEGAETYAALLASMEDDAMKTRTIEGSFIVPDEKGEGSVVNKVKFQPNPTPVMSLTIVYYKP